MDIDLDDDEINPESIDELNEIMQSLQKEIEEEQNIEKNATSSAEETNPSNSDKIENETKMDVEEEKPEATPDEKKQEEKPLIKSDNPEDIINFIKALPPDKLEEIKKVLANCDSKKEEPKPTEPTVSQQPEQQHTENAIESASEKSSDDKVQEEEKIVSVEKPDEENVQTAGAPDPEPTVEPKEIAKEKEQTVNEAPIKKNDEIICLDSDEEEMPPAKEDDKIESSVNKSTIETNAESVPLESEKASVESQLSETPKAKCLRECVNPECPRKLNDTYMESPNFVMSAYYVTRKLNKSQWVCSSCFENAVLLYEKLSTNISQNVSWVDIQLPKKQDLVEILDSDDEDEPTQNGHLIKDSEMIYFDADTEKEMEEILTNLASSIDFNKQVECEQKFLRYKFENLDKCLDDVIKDTQSLEKKSQKVYDELYSFNRPKIQRRPSLNVETIIVSETVSGPLFARVACHEKPKPSETAMNLRKSLPSSISITPIQSTSQQAQTKMAQTKQVSSNDICYASWQRKGTQMAHWSPCKILEDLSTPEGKKFKVQFLENSMINGVVIVSGKEIAKKVVRENLEIGARVIAIFPRSGGKNKTSNPNLKRYLPGVIGEKLTTYNKRRYLVFCDYGQVKYCPPVEVLEIMEASENVWEDVHMNLRQFIRDYLESKTNRSRALLNVRVNNEILTEQGGNWSRATVTEVDCSLVRVCFKHNQTYEWLYRGSKRLYTMYQQAQRTNNTYQRRNDPTISFITIDEDAKENQNETKEKSIETKNKNIARKSSSAILIHPQPQPQTPQVQPSSTNEKIIILNDDRIYLEEPTKVGKVRHFTPKASICAKTYVAHECSASCIPPLTNDLSNFSPISKPLLVCWERQLVRLKNNRLVVYKAPCGRRLRNMHEVFVYLNMTKNFLNVDNFTFDSSLQVLASYVVDPKVCGLYIPDLAEGKEGMKIPCINAFDDIKPPPLKYSPCRVPMANVHINTDPEFMSCCDCTDECVDKSKCACFQLTIRGAKYRDVMEESEDDISYVWKRLLGQVPTGIYECNSRCKCSSRCLNKVVQQPIAVKMQLYRTKNRGWGLESLHDIPKGTFVCIYAGNLYSEKDANALCQGLEHGDEYFAELDLIETAERCKDGYESGVVYPDDSDNEKASDSDSDYDDRKDANEEEDGDFVSKSRHAHAGNREILTRSSKTSITQLYENTKKSSSESSTPQRNNSEDSSDDEMVNMMPNPESSVININNPYGRISLRKLYGPKERVYIMDAKKCGNVGRYFNHSCDPNLFVQSVFVDTHDLRFPWIAFFALRAIKAGEELTWNYNYEVGSVPTKVLFCKCGAKNCRGRIL